MNKSKVVKKDIGKDTSTKPLDEYLRNKEREEHISIVEKIIDTYSSYTCPSHPIQKCIGQRSTTRRGR